jgi:hypothetical protein
MLFSLTGHGIVPRPVLRLTTDHLASSMPVRKGKIDESVKRIQKHAYPDLQVVETSQSQPYSHEYA